MSLCDVTISKELFEFKKSFKYGQEDNKRLKLRFEKTGFNPISSMIEHGGYQLKRVLVCLTFAFFLTMDFSLKQRSIA